MHGIAHVSLSETVGQTEKRPWTSGPADPWGLPQGRGISSPSKQYCHTMWPPSWQGFTRKYSTVEVIQSKNIHFARTGLCLHITRIDQRIGIGWMKNKPSNINKGGPHVACSTCQACATFGGFKLKQGYMLTRVNTT